MDPYSYPVICRLSDEQLRAARISRRLIRRNASVWRRGLALVFYDDDKSRCNHELILLQAAECRYPATEEVRLRF